MDRLLGVNLQRVLRCGGAKPSAREARISTSNPENRPCEGGGHFGDILRCMSPMSPYPPREGQGDIFKMSPNVPHLITH